VIAAVTRPDAATVEIPDLPPVLSGSSLSRLVHELRGPLGGIVSLTGLMRLKITQGPVAAEQQSRQLELMSGSAAGLLATVERVVALARLEETGTETGAEPADCGAVAGDVVTGLAGAARDRGRRLRFDPPEEPVLAAAATSAVTTIVTELLDNAIKYASAAGIDVRAYRTPDTRQPVISVRDHGPGLTADDLPRIFQPFERGAAAHEVGESGTGLGLCLVQRTAMRYGGTLSAVSGPAGTTFTVTLPAAA
jgi:signal transduction histidine kinase